MNGKRHFGGASKIEAAERARKELPPGHVGIREAEEALTKEYAACKEIEQAFCKQMGKAWSGSFLSYQEAADFSASLCRALGTRVIKAVRPIPPETSYGVGGYYSQRTIYVGRGNPNLVSHWRIFRNNPYKDGLKYIVILHETAHHIQYEECMWAGGTHGKDFLAIEQMFFKVLLGR
jgi:hypothetical protein